MIVNKSKTYVIIDINFITIVVFGDFIMIKCGAPVKVERVENMNIKSFMVTATCVLMCFITANNVFYYLDNYPDKRVMFMIRM